MIVCFVAPAQSILALRSTALHGKLFCIAAVLSGIETELAMWVVFQLFAWVALHYPVYISYREERRRVKRLSINSSTRELDLTLEQV